MKMLHGGIRLSVPKASQRKARCALTHSSFSLFVGTSTGSSLTTAGLDTSLLWQSRIATSAMLNVGDSTS